MPYTLADSFKEALLDQCAAMKNKSKEVGVRYRPSYLLKMIEERGGVGAAKHLLASARPQNGFAELWQNGLLPYTVEALVLNPKWVSLFTDEEIEVARKRLIDAGYVLDDNN